MLEPIRVKSAKAKITLTEVKAKVRLLELSEKKPQIIMVLL